MRLGCGASSTALSPRLWSGAGGRGGTCHGSGAGEYYVNTFYDSTNYIVKMWPTDPLVLNPLSQRLWPRAAGRGGACGMSVKDKVD